jgi:hypothetical protein
MTATVTEQYADELEAKQLMRDAYELRRQGDAVQARNLERLARRIEEKY